MDYERDSEPGREGGDTRPTKAESVVALAVTVLFGVAALPVDGWSGIERAVAAVVAFFATFLLFGRFPRLAQKVMDVLTPPVSALAVGAFATGLVLLLVAPDISISGSLSRVLVAAGSGILCVVLPTVVLLVSHPGAVGIRLGPYCVFVFMIAVIVALAFSLLRTNGVVTDSVLGAVFVGVATVSFMSWLATSLRFAIKGVDW